ncbi:MAG: DUF3024 domain-containing protein [Allomuricauda sp.]
MALTEFEIEKIKLAMEGFMEKRRPPERIRNELDLGYRIEKQSVEIFEIRDLWNRPGEKIKEMVAKATFVKSANNWKIYWQRADLKWHRYDPNPEVQDFEKFLEVVDKDELCCFWG